ncbi:MAG: chemoreceptor glutamine deamidase CheD [Burkholderiales bacterium]|nr:chemoreceptor glutamine deamidase CheD [Burkholderiales bacterium]
MSAATPHRPSGTPAASAADSGRAAPAAGTGARPGSPERLERLKSWPRRPGQASFFFYDAHFRSEAVKVLPGEFFVFDEDIAIMTTLGSCIAACLWDRERRVGGMNHFMLPEGDSAADGGRYGSYAMELLINEMLRHGASRATMEAKVFGGGAVLSGMSKLNVGERNTAFVLDYLRAERIPVVSKDVMDIYPRKVCFLPASGKALVKRLASGNTEMLLAQETAATRAAAPMPQGAGAIELFSGTPSAPKKGIES